MPAIARPGKFLLLTLLIYLCDFKESRAQTLEILSDSVIAGVRNKRVETLMAATPSYSDLKVIFDSVYKDRGEPFILMKEQRIKALVRRQAKKLQKELKSEKIDARKIKLLRVVKEEGTDSMGVTYAIVKCRCEAGNKRFTVSYVALSCGGQWHLADELKLEQEEEE